MAYLQIALLSLAFCLGNLGINAFSVTPEKHFENSQSNPLVYDHRNERFREMIQQQLAAIGSFEVSMPANFAFLRSLLALLTPRAAPAPALRQFVGGKKDEFASKQAKKYNDDPCDDAGCLKACNFIFEKDYGFCSDVMWCVCYD